MVTKARDSTPLTLCASTPEAVQSPALKCSSDAAAVQAHVLLLIGVPSSPTSKGRKRRAAIRAAWMQDAHVGRSVVVCFLLSAETPQPQLAELQAEAAEHGDVMLVDAPETPWLIRRATSYSNGTKRGRGMPTFKQHRFFQLAASKWPAVPFVGKFDDDTAPNLRLLVPWLRSLRCASPRFMFNPF